MAKVSVIIPNYNHGRYLRERIESVLNQTFVDIEVLILDDCSTDDSIEIIQGFAQRDNRIMVLVNERNSGNTFQQWNKGVELAKGEYVWIAESDDIADVEFLDRLVPIVEKDTKIGLAYCQSYQINEKSDIISSWLAWTEDIAPGRWEKDFVTGGRQELEKYFSLKNTIPNASAVIIRRELYNKVGGAPSNLKLCGDKLFWTKVLLQTNLAFVSQPLNYFRSHTQNVRSTISSLSNLRENLEWYCYLNKRIDVPKGNKKYVYNWLTNWWGNNVKRRGWNILESTQSRDILFYAYKIDILLFFRFINKIIYKGKF